MSRCIIGAVEKPRLKLERPCCACKRLMAREMFAVYAYVTNQHKTSLRVDSMCRECRRIARKNLRDREGNREKDRLVSREWKKANPERVRVMGGKWRKINQESVNAKHRALAGDPRRKRQRVESEQKRRLRARGADTKEVKQLIRSLLDQYKVGNLYLDGYSGDLISNPTIDHVVPISRGGQHVAENLILTSFANNRSKRDTPLLVWMARRVRE